MKNMKKLACLACAGIVVATPFAFLGCGANTVDVKADVAGDLNYISEHVYNQLSADLTYDNLGENFDKFYAEIGKVQGEGAFKLGGKEYDGENYKLSVGKKKFVNAPRYVVKEDKLYVASYFLSLKAGNSNTVEVKYGNTTFNVQVTEGAKLNADVATVAANAGDAIVKADGKYNIAVANSTTLYKMTFKNGEDTVKPKYFVTEKLDKVGNTTTVSYGYTEEEVANEGWLGFYAVSYGDNVADDLHIERDYTVAPVGYKPVTVKLDITKAQA